LFLRQHSTSDLDALGGLYRSNPAVATLILIPIFSLAGTPPLSGFVAKLAIVTAALEARSLVLAAVALIIGLLTLLSMARVWEQVVWTPAPPSRARPLGRLAVAPIAALVVATLGLTVAAGPVFAASVHAAGLLLDPAQYIQDVLGGE